MVRNEDLRGPRAHMRDRERERERERGEREREKRETRERGERERKERGVGCTSIARAVTVAFASGLQSVSKTVREQILGACVAL